jgi:AcrR family transcriptional regulator
MSVSEVSIPAVAEALDVGVTSIYWHVRNKTELLDAMTDRALRNSGPLAYEASPDWRVSMCNHARGVRATFLRNPVLADLILVRGALSPTARRLGLQESQKAIAAMVDAGVGEERAVEIYDAVSVLVRGSVLLERLGHAGGSDPDDPQQVTSARAERAFERLLAALLTEESSSGSAG